MSGTGENPSRGSLSTRAKKTPFDEMTGDETGMSIGDQKTMGPTFGFSEVLDSPNSCLFNNLAPSGGAVPYRGNGFTNNLPFSRVATGFGSSSQGSIGAQNKNCVNESTQRRLGRTVDLSATGTGLAAE